MSVVIKFVCLVFLLGPVLQLVAQTKQAEVHNPDLAVYNFQKVYRQYMGDQAGLYNGRQYLDYRHTIKEGSPFLDTPQVRRGWVVYNGFLHENALLLFDILKNKLITVTPGSKNMLELVNERVSSFNIAGRKFVNLADDTLKTKLTAGFYEVLFEGKKSVILKKYHKETKEDLSEKRVMLNIISKNFYFVHNERGFQQLTNKKSFLNAFSDQRSAVNSFMKKIKLRNKTKQDSQLIELAAYYDNL